MLRYFNYTRTFLPTLNSLYVQDVVEKWTPEADSIVLNIGSGRRNYQHIESSSCLVTSVDIQLFRDTDVQATVYQLPFADETFSAVIATELFEHLEDPRQAIEEIRRVLRPGGELISTVPFLFRIHGDPEDYFRYTGDGLRALIKDLFAGEIRPYGNKFTVIMDILSTSDRKWQPGKALRLFNRLIFPLVRKRVNKTFPSGLGMFLKKC